MLATSDRGRAAALAAAWVNSVRQRAANSGNPVVYMRAAYDKLGEETQTALGRKKAFENLLGSAWGGTPGGRHAYNEPRARAKASALGIPHIPASRGLGSRVTSCPFAAREMLVSPGAARFGAGLSGFGGVAVTTANLAAQSVAERARQRACRRFSVALGMPHFGSSNGSRIASIALQISANEGDNPSDHAGPGGL